MTAVQTKLHNVYDSINIRHINTIRREEPYLYTSRNISAPTFSLPVHISQHFSPNFYLTCTHLPAFQPQLLPYLYTSPSISAPTFTLPVHISKHLSPNFYLTCTHLPAFQLQLLPYLYTSPSISGPTFTLPVHISQHLSYVIIMVYQSTRCCTEMISCR